MFPTAITTMTTIVHVGTLGDGVGVKVGLEDGELERGLEVGNAVGDWVGLGALKTHSELH